MYESHFGLKTRPFGSKAEGDAVFVGPGQVDIVNALHKGLLVQDAIVTVSGPVGSGKTTVVNRGLETMSPGRMAAWVGRMKVSAEEILELLLAGFGFNRKSLSTLQRFAAFRRYMHERAAGGVPVAIVIEDARKLGAAVLAEIEALTASDTADGGGANIILMGDEGLNGLLADPELARLKQRIRRRMQVRPLTKAETAGYLKHAIRVAGGEYDAVFAQDVAEIVHACSEGMPRVINSLCESAMTAAKDAGDTRVSAQLVHEIAVNDFGFDGPAPTADVQPHAPEPSIDPEPPPADEPPVVAPEAPSLQASMSIPGIRDEDIPETARNLVVEFGRYPEEPPSFVDRGSEAPVEERPEESREDSADQSRVGIDAAEPTQDFSVPVDDEPTLTDIPEFINDTQPQLDALSEAVGELLAASRDKETAAVPAPSADNDSDDDEETFDLDAALSPDVESTNMMPGITPNLDELVASETTGPEPTPPAAPEFDDLPTLSDSMRVDVKKEVEKAERIEAKNAEDAVEPESAIAGAPATAEAPLEGDEAPPEVDFGDVLDSVLEAQPQAGSSVNVNKTDNEQDAAAREEAPAELSLQPSLERKPSFELSLDREPEAEPSLDESALEPDPELMLEAETQAEPIAEDAVTAKAVPESTSEDIQDNAPVMHEPSEHAADLATDLDALEAALQAAKSGDFGPAPSSPRKAAPSNTAKPGPVADTPEITIDRVLADQQAQTRKLEAFTAALEGVSSLEEIDDLMAETLFGEEFAAIADSVVAEGQLVDPNARNSSDTPVEIDDAPIEASNDDAARLEEAPAVNGSRPREKVSNGNGELRESVALRIDVLNQMKAKIANERTEVVELGEGHGHEPRARGPQPEPIERQINTSMTQTLQALKVAQTADAVAEEKSKKKSGGLFSRFRRSS